MSKTEGPNKQELEEEPGTPEEAVERIREEIDGLLTHHTAGIPDEVLDTADKNVPREKINHPARASWFSLVSMMLANVMRYRKQHLVYVPKNILDDIEEFDYVISRIDPHKPIDHRRVTDAVRLIKTVSKEIAPGIQL